MPVGIFILLFSKIGITEVKGVFKEINPDFLILGIVLSVFGNLFLSAEKWRQILKALGLNIPFKKLFLIHTGSIPLKTVSPMKSGMLLRAVYLNKNYNFPLLQGTYSLLLSLFLNLLAVFSFILVTSFFLRTNSYRLVYFGLAVFSFCLAFFWVLKRENVSKVIKGYLNLWGNNFALSLKNFYESVITITIGKMIIPFFYAVLLIFFELLNFKILSKAVGLVIPFSQILLFASLTILISNLPVTIHGLGTREAAVCFFFSGYGSSEKLLSLGITISLVEYFFPVFIGLFLTKSFLARLPAIGGQSNG
ncbi:MAG: lysylphosphatidylglycerol synthase transmembrane domain-containing protein [Nitrospirota bacterium]|nr:lysylphosphatidylglycerol synthase transmembrane domain-containing protein [Nitrospirota bacterium]